MNALCGFVVCNCTFKLGNHSLLLIEPNFVSMKINYLLGAMGMVALLGISACGDDDPPPKSGISFEVESFEVFESDGTITSFHPDLQLPGTTSRGKGKDLIVKILLDRPLSETTILQYSVSGTASRTTTSNAVSDYALKEGLNTIIGTDKITIEKGATEANFIITVYEDYAFEIDDDDNLFETVVITLNSVVSGNAELGVQNVYTLKIKEDDSVVFLEWDAGDGTEGDVDMDLLLFFDNVAIRGSASEGSDYEAMAIPAGFPAGTYGLSYPYYSGSSDDLEFYSVMFTTTGTLNGNQYVFPSADPLVFVGNYTLANINEWHLTNSPPQVVQTLVKNGINYTNISAINEPASGSRVADADIRFERYKNLKLSDLKEKLNQSSQTSIFRK